MFPKSDYIANVGIGISAKYGGKGKSAKVLLNSFIHDMFPNSKVESEAVGGIPISKSIEKMVGNLEEEVDRAYNDPGDYVDPPSEEEG